MIFQNQYPSPSPRRKKTTYQKQCIACGIFGLRITKNRCQTHHLHLRTTKCHHNRHTIICIITKSSSLLYQQNLRSIHSKKNTSHAKLYFYFQPHKTIPKQSHPEIIIINFYHQIPFNIMIITSNLIKIKQFQIPNSQLKYKRNETNRSQGQYQ